MARYRPKPIDTAHVKLSPAQAALVEALAANVHEVWAQTRLADGWKPGKKRDDNAKTHPCLIPYDRLPASEQAYDRVMVTQVIKAAVALGYRIGKR